MDAATDANVQQSNGNIHMNIDLGGAGSGIAARLKAGLKSVFARKQANSDDCSPSTSPAKMEHVNMQNGTTSINGEETDPFTDDDSALSNGEALELFAKSSILKSISTRLPSTQETTIDDSLLDSDNENINNSEPPHRKVPITNCTDTNIYRTGVTQDVNDLMLDKSQTSDTEESQNDVKETVKKPEDVIEESTSQPFETSTEESSINNGSEQPVKDSTEVTNGLTEKTLNASGIDTGECSDEGSKTIENSADQTEVAIDSPEKAEVAVTKSNTNTNVTVNITLNIAGNGISADKTPAKLDVKDTETTSEEQPGSETEETEVTAEKAADAADATEENANNSNSEPVEKDEENMETDVTPTQSSSQPVSAASAESKPEEESKVAQEESKTETNEPEPMQVDPSFDSQTTSQEEPPQNDSRSQEHIATSPTNDSVAEGTNSSTSDPTASDMLGSTPKPSDTEATSNQTLNSDTPSADIPLSTSDTQISVPPSSTVSPATKVEPLTSDGKQEEKPVTKSETVPSSDVAHSDSERSDTSQRSTASQDRIDKLIKRIDDVKSDNAGKDESGKAVITETEPQTLMTRNGLEQFIKSTVDKQIGQLILKNKVAKRDEETYNQFTIQESLMKEKISDVNVMRNRLRSLALSMKPPQRTVSTQISLSQKPLDKPATSNLMAGAKVLKSTINGVTKTSQPSSIVSSNSASPAQTKPTVVQRPPQVKSSEPPRKKPNLSQVSSSTTSTKTKPSSSADVVDLTEDDETKSLHPAPLPPSTGRAYYVKIPPPSLEITSNKEGIVLQWNIRSIDLNKSHAPIKQFQIYGYKERPGPLTGNEWKKVGDLKALPLPMACTLTQFQAGSKYHFAVRAIDEQDRPGIFSVPRSAFIPKPTTS